MTKKRKKGKSLKQSIIYHEDHLIESDHYFAFIMGNTSGGAAYGLTHEEWRKIQAEEKIKSTKT